VALAGGKQTTLQNPTTVEVEFVDLGLISPTILIDHRSMKSKSGPNLLNLSGAYLGNYLGA